MRHLLLLLPIALTLVSCGPESTSGSAPDFVDHIKPVIAQRCVNCHHEGALMGDLNLTSKRLAFAPRDAGPVIVPGKPAESRLIQVLNLPERDAKAMPPTGHRISPEEVALLEAWIGAGADWPEDESGRILPAPKVSGEKPSGTAS